MVVSSLKQTTPGRVSVLFEDGSEIKSTLNVVADYRLYSGKELEPEVYEALERDSGRALSFEFAVGILSRRQLSCKELRDKLIQKGQTPETAEYCVSKMLENGLIDDSVYAENVAKHYSAKGYGAGRVKAEFAKRGISRELLPQALNSMSVNNSKLEKFISARLKDPNDPAEVRKVSAALFRRGFSHAQIIEALAAYNADIQEQEYYE